MYWEKKKKKAKEDTFKMPNCLTKVEDTNVAATPIKAHIPLNPPMIDGCKPAEQSKKYIGLSTRTIKK